MTTMEGSHHWPSGSQVGAVLLSRAHSSMSGDMSDCHSLEGGCYWHLLGGGQHAAHTQDSAHPAPKNDLVQKVRLRHRAHVRFYSEGN